MVLQASATSRNAEDLFFFCMPRFVLEMFVGLKMFRDIAKIAKDVVGQGLDHEGQRALVEIDRPSLPELSVFYEKRFCCDFDLANDREESVSFNVLDATFILEFSSSQMFLMLFRDSLGSTETERNALMLEDFS
uniref:Uncharacterized protein n=1 Tax=Brassica oleracea var. oleracea TaxID=109376 RepID=A0A0D3EAB7_BRAOL